MAGFQAPIRVGAVLARKNRKARLKGMISWLALLGLAVFGYVLIDFSFKQVSPPEYRFSVPPLQTDQPVLVTEGNLMLIVARYSQERVKALAPQGRLAGISQAFKGDASALSGEGYFVVRAYGSHTGCPLAIIRDGFKETCSDARYDLLGRSADPGRYADLEQIEYHFSRDHKTLILE